MRSLARARSSSRRAPPNAASKLWAAIASSSVTVCSRLRERRPAPRRRGRCRSSPAREATISRSPSSLTRRSRNSSTSGKLWPVSTCMTGNGNAPGRNAFSASRSSTIESLPPENSSTGRSSSAATSRMMWTASASSARSWDEAGPSCGSTRHAGPRSSRSARPTPRAAVRLAAHRRLGDARRRRHADVLEHAAIAALRIRGEVLVDDPSGSIPRSANQSRPGARRRASQPALRCAIAPRGVDGLAAGVAVLGAPLAGLDRAPQRDRLRELVAPLDVHAAQRPETAPASASPARREEVARV